MRRGVFLSALALLTLFVLPAGVLAEERYALIVSGVSGGDKFADTQKALVASLQSALEKRMGFATERITVLTEKGTRRLRIETA